MSFLFSSEDTVKLEDDTELKKAWNALNNAPSTAGLVGAQYKVNRTNQHTIRVPDKKTSTPKKDVFHGVVVNLCNVTLENGLNMTDINNMTDISKKNPQYETLKFVWHLQEKKKTGTVRVSSTNQFSNLVNVTDDQVEFPTPLGVAPANTTTVYVAYENAAGDTPVVFKMPLLSFRRSVVPRSWDAVTTTPSLYGGLAKNGKTKQPAPAARTDVMGHQAQKPKFSELDA
ncbi:MAG: hypothetical protein PHD48_02645 [Alphaproteobacteria bacterium]|nr:hypothetical protein [Alphaproteobacteria bacterium]